MEKNRKKLSGVLDLWSMKDVKKKKRNKNKAKTVLITLALFWPLT